MCGGLFRRMVQLPVLVLASQRSVHAGTSQGLCGIVEHVQAYRGSSSNSEEHLCVCVQ
jgi:hypothetical protein